MSTSKWLPAIVWRELDFLDKDFDHVYGSLPSGELSDEERVEFLESIQDKIQSMISRCDWLLLNAGDLVNPSQRAILADLKAQLSSAVLDHYYI